MVIHVRVVGPPRPISGLLPISQR